MRIWKKRDEGRQTGEDDVRRHATTRYRWTIATDNSSRRTRANTFQGKFTAFGEENLVWIAYICDMGRGPL
jgi:hypothetical protein